MAVEEVDEKTYKKFRSRRWLLSLWAVAVITGIIVYTMFSKNDNLVILATTLSAIPIGFTTLETVLKMKKGENE